MVVADWIKRIADDERKRDAVRVKEDEMTARKADLVRRNGQRLIDELRATVTRDVEAFRDEFAGDRARDIVVDSTGARRRVRGSQAGARGRLPHGRRRIWRRQPWSATTASR